MTIPLRFSIIHNYFAKKKKNNTNEELTIPYHDKYISMYKTQAETRPPPTPFSPISPRAPL